MVLEMGKARMAITEVTIPPEEIVSTGGARSGTIGHNFILKTKLKVSRRTLGPISGEGIEHPQLEWRKRVDWFELIAPNTWRFATDPHNGITRELVAENRLSNTFKDWVQARYFLATDERNSPPDGLKDAVNAKGVDASLEEKDKLAKHWIANNGFEWTLSITDCPVMELNPKSGGGESESLVTSNSWRRVMHFEVGFNGTSAKVTATQVLESIEGRPTIQKFFLPGISRVVANDEQKLALWRSEFGQENQTFVW
ncbi:unnamed protein product [Calypogeia fissa]